MTLLLRPVSADIEYGDIKSSFSVSSGTVEIPFSDNGNNPPFSELTTYTILLCTGPNSQIHCFDNTPVATGSSVSSLNDEISLDLTQLAAVGSSGPYYLQFVAQATDGGQVIHYSSRFNLEGMQGTFQATSGGDTAPPPDSDDVGQLPASASSSFIAHWMTVPYAQQTLLTKVAPMQLQPGSKVTKGLTPSARYGTSAVTFYKTARMSLAVYSTITPSRSYTFTGYTNYASSLPTPTAFYAASEAQKSAIASFTKAAPAPKSKRWLD